MLDTLIDPSNNNLLPPDVIFTPQQNELQAYVNKTFPRKLNDFDFYRKESFNFPVLSELNKTFLFIPLASADVVFSLVQVSLTQKRTSLSEKTSKEIVILRSYKGKL